MTTFFVAFLFFLGRATLAARRRELARHAEWMTRTAFTIVTPLTRRLIFPLIAATTPIRSRDQFWDLFLTAAWLAWAIDVAVTLQSIS